MTEMMLHIADDLLFTCIGLSALYLILFAVASHWKQNRYRKSEKMYRFAILTSSETSLTIQNYPKELYDIIRYKDLTSAVNDLNEANYDLAVILSDAPCEVSSLFLNKINNAYAAGIQAIQLHSINLNRQNFIDRIRAIRAEIDNSIAGKGNTQFGFSATFKGPDIAVDLKWLKRNQKTFRSNLERKLLKQNIYIDYLDDAIVFSQLTPSPCYLTSKKKSVSQLSHAFLNANWSYLNRIFQWLLPSPTCLFMLTLCWAIFCTGYAWILSLKWWGMLFVISFIISLSIPDYLIRDKKRKKNKQS